MGRWRSGWERWRTWRRRLAIKEATERTEQSGWQTRTDQAVKRQLYNEIGRDFRRR